MPGCLCRTRNARYMGPGNDSRSSYVSRAENRQPFPPKLILVSLAPLMITRVGIHLTLCLMGLKSRQIYISLFMIDEAEKPFTFF